MDYCHQYVNVFGETRTSWVIDEQEFHTPRDAEAYLKYTYGLSQTETIKFLRSLPTQYN